MKAIVLNRYGGPEVLEVTDRPVPEPGPGEILIRMHSAGISRPDKIMRMGTYPWTKDILPFYPGVYGSGTVAGLGDGVTAYTIGQPVYVEQPFVCGCYAEYKLAPERYVLPVPEGTDLRLAAVAISYFTVWGMLTECFPKPEGKSLYIQGAAGGIGTAVCQIAPLLGMRVIASASTREKCEYLKSVSSADVFRYTEQDPKETVLSLTNGRGCDIIMDQAVGEAFLGQLDFLAPMGTILIYNNTKGFPSQNVIEAMTDRFADCIGIRAFSFHYFDDKPELLRSKKQEVFTLLNEGKITPRISAAFPLEDVQAAHTLLDSGDFFGNIVLDCS